MRTFPSKPFSVSKFERNLSRIWSSVNSPDWNWGWARTEYTFLRSSTVMTPSPVLSILAKAALTSATLEGDIGGCKTVIVKTIVYLRYHSLWAEGLNLPFKTLLNIPWFPGETRWDWRSQICLGRTCRRAPWCATRRVRGPRRPCPVWIRPSLAPCFRRRPSGGTSGLAPWCRTPRGKGRWGAASQGGRRSRPAASWIGRSSAAPGERLQTVAWTTSSLENNQTDVSAFWTLKPPIKTKSACFR